MKFTIEEITYFRGNTHHYVIYDTEGDIHLIFGTFYRKVVGGSLYDSTISFIKDNSHWDYARKRIEWNRDNEEKEKGDKWLYMNNEFKNLTIDLEELYLDGVKKDLNLIEKIK